MMPDKRKRFGGTGVPRITPLAWLLIVAAIVGAAIVGVALAWMARGM